MAVDDVQFQALLEQVRELHRLVDELTRSRARIHDNVRARLSWSQQPQALTPDQRELVDRIVALLEERRLSSSQARQLQRAFFGN